MDQRSGQRHALFLPTGKGSRPLTCAVVQPDGGQGLQRLRFPVTLQPQPDVIYHRFPRQQTRVLKHHAGIFLDLCQRGVPGQQFTAVWRFQPGQQAQQGAFTATAAAHDRHELPGRDMQFQLVQNGVFAVAFGDAVEQQRRTLV